MPSKPPLVIPSHPKDFAERNLDRNVPVPEIEKTQGRIPEVILKLGDKEISIPKSSRLHAILSGKLEGGYKFDKADGEDSIIVVNPEGEKIGKIPLDASKDEIEIRGDFLQGLKKVFDSEKVKVNEEIGNVPENDPNLEDIRRLKNELFK
jgi:hypothetical protein